MSYTSEHRRMAPVLAKARELDIATNPAPEALFESLTAGFNLWCTLEDHPKGWDSVLLIAGTFSKPCGFVGTASWKWDDDRIVAISLGADAYELADRHPKIFSRTAGKVGLASTTGRKTSNGRSKKSAGCSQKPAGPVHRLS
jgi:hypothetical protein